MAKVIFLHGTSSCGKSTLAKALQAKLDIPFWHFASDQLVEAGMLPPRSNDDGPFDWKSNRPRFFDAFHGCIKAILDSGNNIILDHIIESDSWYHQLKQLLDQHDVFFVGIHCPVTVLRRREKERGDKHVGNRYQGEAEYHLQHVHGYGEYDMEIDSSIHKSEILAQFIIEQWNNREERSRFFN